MVAEFVGKMEDKHLPSEPEKDETPKTGAMTGNIVVMIIVLAVTIFTVKFANKKRV